MIKYVDPRHVMARGIPTEERWDRWFVHMARNLAHWHSKDPSNQVGAVIATGQNPLSFGYNGPIRGVADSAETFTNRARKLCVTEHAERNALYNALRNGVDVRGSTIYVTHMCCVDCAKGICQSGVVRVCHGTNEDFEERWAESISQALDIFKEVGVVVDRIQE